MNLCVVGRQFFVLICRRFDWLVEKTKNKKPNIHTNWQPQTCSSESTFKQPYSDAPPHFYLLSRSKFFVFFRMIPLRLKIRSSKHPRLATLETTTTTTTTSSPSASGLSGLAALGSSLGGFFGVGLGSSGSGGNADAAATAAASEAEKEEKEEEGVGEEGDGGAA